MRRISVLLASGLLAGLVSVAPVDAAPLDLDSGNCGARAVRAGLKAGAMETVALKTFHLVIHPQKKAYKVGDVAKIHVNVTRPAKEDPLGNGIPMEAPNQMAAEGVSVGVGLRVGDVFLFGASYTDENGDATVKVELKDYTPGGMAIADVFAWQKALDTPCAKIEENGYQHSPNIFKVVRKL